MGIFIKQNDSLYLKWDNNDRLFYDEVPIYTDIARALRLISESSEHWKACESTDSVLKLPHRFKHFTYGLHNFGLNQKQNALRQNIFFHQYYITTKLYIKYMQIF